MGKGYLLVEGSGEVEAAGNLITRLWRDLELPFLAWGEPIRQPALHRERGLQIGCERIRRRADAEALLVLRDEDDGCPREIGPAMARWVADLGLPFPVAVVLLHREYEVLFLPCAHLMAGQPLRDRLGTSRPGLVAGTRFKGDPESIRGVKEWLSGRFPKNRSYKPTLDQLPLTRMIEFETLRAARVPSFGTLERALRFLAQRLGTTATYPPAPRTGADATADR